MSTIDEQLAKKIHDMAEKKGVVLPKSEYIYFLKEPERNLMVPRYQTDELLEMLPAEIEERMLVLDKEDTKQYLAYYEAYGEEGDIQPYKSCSTPSQALGELYFYCISNDLIK